MGLNVSIIRFSLKQFKILVSADPSNTMYKKLHIRDIEILTFKLIVTETNKPVILEAANKVEEKLWNGKLYR